MLALIAFVIITSGEIFTGAHLDFAPVFNLHGEGWSLVANDHTTGTPLPLWARDVRHQDLSAEGMVVDGAQVRGNLSVRAGEFPIWAPGAQAPFTMTGTLNGQAIEGGGTVTIHPNMWTEPLQLAGVTFTFTEASPIHTPEPLTLGLLGTGLGLIALRRVVCARKRAV